MRKVRSIFKTLMHVLVYALVILLLTIVCTGLSDSIRGYSLIQLSGSYYNVTLDRRLTFSEGKVSVQTANIYREFSFVVEEGTLTFSDEAYWVYANGLLAKEGNHYYVKI